MEHRNSNSNRRLVPLDLLQQALYAVTHNLEYPFSMPIDVADPDAAPPSPDMHNSPAVTQPAPATPLPSDSQSAPSPQQAQLPSAAPSSASPTHSAPSAPSPPSHACLWEGCTLFFPDPEALYNHLCNAHIGRKSTNNLCLTCRWRDCGTTCAKRDHITSHLRVHTPLKPHVCAVCDKSFKRPQDLKKHEKIHTEAHHAQHRHSKAITVVDPAYSQRVSTGSSLAPIAALPGAPADSRAKASSVSSQGTPGQCPTFSPRLTKTINRDPFFILKKTAFLNWKTDTNIEFSPPSSMPSLSLSPDFGLLPTPSPELGHAPNPHRASFHHSHPHPHSHGHHSHQQDAFLLHAAAGASAGVSTAAGLPTWEVLRDEPAPGAGTGPSVMIPGVTGMKRGHDQDAVEEFFTDMKKRRVSPSYDPRQYFFFSINAFNFLIWS